MSFLVYEKKEKIQKITWNPKMTKTELSQISLNFPVKKIIIPKFAFHLKSAISLCIKTPKTSVQT